VSLSSAGQEPVINWLLLFSFENPLEETHPQPGGESWESKRMSPYVDQREETEGRMAFRWLRGCLPGGLRLSKSCLV